jgi:ATP-dependent Clp protease, protease subunit
LPGGGGYPIRQKIFLLGGFCHVNVKATARMQKCDKGVLPLGARRNKKWNDTMTRNRGGAKDEEGPVEIALVGDLTDNEADLSEKLLGVAQGGECTLYIDSPGGSPYCALSLTALIRLRQIRATGIVTGECSSAALWPFAACARRMVMPYSVMLFHPMKWQSEEHVGLREAAEWARHFAELEQDMDKLLVEMFGQARAQVSEWIASSRYVSGRELAATGLAELVDLKPLKLFAANGTLASPRNKPAVSRGAKKRTRRVG